LSTLSEINLLKVIGIEKEQSKNAIRIRFVAGNRAIHYFNECLKRESVLNAKLCVPPIQHIEFIEKNLNEKKDNSKKLDIYSEELATLVGLSIANSLKSGEAPIFVHHRASADLKFIMKMADAVLSVHSQALVFVSGDDSPITSASSNVSNSTSSSSSKNGTSESSKKNTNKKDKNNSSTSATTAVTTIENSEQQQQQQQSLKLITTTTAAATTSTINGPFVLFGKKELVDSLKSQILTIVSGRGGGRPGRLQGQATDLSSKNIDNIRTLLSTVEM
jgi:alanyl-tRNA synthetase